MVRTCKYVERNREECKCSDYFISHSKGGTVMCRLTEWKKKIGVCPYDKSISSFGNKLRKKRNKEQTNLGAFQK